MEWNKTERPTYSRANLQSSEDAAISSPCSEQGNSLALFNWNFMFTHGPHLKIIINQQELVQMRIFILEERKPRKMCLLLSNIWRAIMEMQALTSRVAPVGGNYHSIDCSTSLPAFSQRGKLSFLDQPLSWLCPSLFPPWSALSSLLIYYCKLYLFLFFFFSEKRSLPISPVFFSFSLLYPDGL